MFEMASHAIDLINYMFGKPDKVAGKNYQDAQMEEDRTQRKLPAAQQLGRPRSPSVLLTVEADDAAVEPPHSLTRADDDGLHHRALLHLAVRQRVADRDDDDVADGRVTALGAAEHLDAEDLARAGVVGDVEDGLDLDHTPIAFSTTAWRVQRLSRERGRQDTMLTVSPILASFFSSCAL